MRPILLLALLICGIGIGAAAAYWKLTAPKAGPDDSALVTRMRDVARLETLEVNLYKKVSFEPDPEATGSLWGDVSSWARHSLRQPKGKAIVFATARVGLDLSKLDARSVRTQGTSLYLVLPPLHTTVELKPGETEVIGSNLDSAQTAQLLELAKQAFEREITEDAALRSRARESAERALRGLFATVGYRDVVFTDILPGGPS